MVEEPTLDYDLEISQDARHYQEMVYASMAPFLGRRVLEFGCGSGNVTSLLLREDREVWAIDQNPALIQAIQKRLGGSPRLEIRLAQIGEIGRERPGDFDSVVSSNTLEHIPDGDEAEVIQTSFALLKPGGTSVHWVPATPWVYGSLDRLWGHQRRYTKESLTALFVSAGFKILRCRYWNGLGLLPYAFTGRLLKASTLSRRSALLYDRLALAILRRVEPFLWLPTGLSLSIAAQRPSSVTLKPPARGSLS
jgi:SAM-dependent methyltransferase